MSEGQRRSINKSQGPKKDIITVAEREQQVLNSVPVCVTISSSVCTNEPSGEDLCTGCVAVTEKVLKKIGRASCRERV